MSNEADTENKRRFSRIPFHSKVLIRNDKDKWPGQLIDISLKGVLTSLPSNWSGQPGDQFQIEIILDSSDVVIRMDVSVAHIEDDHMGLTCDHIDIDSISHLRRLVELNIGDSEILQRELSELIHHD